MNRSEQRFEAMPPEKRFEFMATANRVTVDFIDLMVDKKKKQFKRFYVAKVRGIPICDKDGEWKFDRPELARAFGRAVLAEWKAEFSQSAFRREGVTA